MSETLERATWTKNPRCEFCQHWTHRPLPKRPLVGHCTGYLPDFIQITLNRDSCYYFQEKL